MDSDLDIARKATTRPIEEVAERLGLQRSDLILQGSSIAKVSWDRLKQASNGKQGFLILVTSVNPTPFGEGKTVTTIGLNQGLNRRGHNATCVIREPSMGLSLESREELLAAASLRYCRWRKSTCISPATYTL